MLFRSIHTIKQRNYIICPPSSNTSVTSTLVKMYLTIITVGKRFFQWQIYRTSLQYRKCRINSLSVSRMNIINTIYFSTALSTSKYCYTSGERASASYVDHLVAQIIESHFLFSSDDFF